MLSPLRVLLSTRWRPASRLCSGYVARMRYLNRLKTDDQACLTALQSATIHLFHRLSPLLRRSQQQHGPYSLPALNTSEVQQLLERLGKDRSMVEDSVLIGCTEDNHAHFCLDLGGLEKEPIEETCKATFIDLRKAFFVLRGEQAPLVARGQALLRWHQGHGFCSATGQPTVRNQSGSHRVCHTSDIIYYPKMSPVVIVLVSDGKRCLLGRQSTFRPGMYSALAGFCDMGETVEETLCREVAEEVGLEVNSITYSGSQHWPFPQSSFMVACHAAVSPEHTQLHIDHTELEDARWFTLDEVTAALRIKAPPKNAPGQPITFWVPPPYAIASQLITEWAGQQHV